MRILIVGGGHAHVEVLRRFGSRRAPGTVLTLVSPAPATPYSGMLPGVVAGHYDGEELRIPLGPLCERAGASFVVDRVVGLDLTTRTASLASGARVDFDVVSLDVGSAPAISADGAAEHAIGAKPIDRFLSAWNESLTLARSRSVRTIAVVGGLGGAELALAMRHRLGVLRLDVSVHLITAQWNLSPALLRRLLRALRRHDVAVHAGRTVRKVEANAIVLDDGDAVVADRIFWAAGAAAPPWLRASGFACDDAGFVRVDGHLRSPSHPFAFAAGDCAAQDGHRTPKSGVYAVRQGPVLAENLIRTIRGQPLRRYIPQARALALVATGGRSAIASYGNWTVEGRLVWRWKDMIDRAFIARYAVRGPG